MKPALDLRATRWLAPAKLNLFLHIVARRGDGYHALQTAFQLIDLADEILIEPLADDRIERVSGPPGVASEDDLTLRAARALQAASGERVGARITLHKRIPLGGGLGGGSSDAATVLLVLNRMWGLHLPLAELARIGLTLGADVPVFVHGSSAWGEGLGERLTPIELPPRWFVVIHPGIAVASRDVFQAPELTRNSPVITIRGFSESGGRNDCEPCVRARHPEVGAALDWLARHGAAALTGTGSCVFAPFAEEAAARSVAERVPDVWRAYVARGLARSPLHDQLAVAV